MVINGNISKVRKKSFAIKYAINPELAKIINQLDFGVYIKSPALLNTFLYLTNYVKIFSEYWFSKNINKLQLLDWGCGIGHNSYILKSMGFIITACDIKFEAEKFAKAGNFSFVLLKHDHQLPFNDNYFDVVLSFGVLEHVPNDFQSLKEINRVLKTSGLFFCFNLPHFLSISQRVAPLLGHVAHRRLYSEGLVKNLLGRSNFNLINIWHRQIFPKNIVKYYNYQIFERIDQFLVNYTFLRYLATSIEFIASKK